MANRFYAPGEERAAKVHHLFATVARRYDLINDLQSFGLHRWWKVRLVRIAKPARGRQALDICCGTGDVALGLARAGCEVTGLDFSPEMLAVAERRAVGLGSLPAGSCNFIRGDAQALPMADASFEVATISYGLRNLADLERGLGETWRVLRPGGLALALDFGKPDNPLLRAAYLAYLRWLVPVFGWLLVGDAATHAYILESLHHYPGQRGVQEKMRQAGFVNTRIVNLLGGIMSINVGERPK
jgi:ubiquinone/menaquinone biosynthesis methyltransferase